MLMIFSLLSVLLNTLLRPFGQLFQGRACVHVRPLGSLRARIHCTRGRNERERESRSRQCCLSVRETNPLSLSAEKKKTDMWYKRKEERKNRTEEKYPALRWYSAERGKLHRFNQLSTADWLTWPVGEKKKKKKSFYFFLRLTKETYGGADPFFFVAL